MSYIVIIPARGGSKGIINKNMHSLLGKPLISYTIEAAKSIFFNSQIYVSSDSEEIINFAKNSKVNGIKRPKELAEDSSHMYPVIEHACIEAGAKNDDIVILLQPTSPLRNKYHLAESIEAFEGDKVRSLISGVLVDSGMFKLFHTNKEGFLKGLHSDESPFIRRQDCPPVFKANGAIYFFYWNDLRKKRDFFLERTLPYIMSDRDSIDVDTIEDINKIEQILKESI